MFTPGGRPGPARPDTRRPPGNVNAGWGRGGGGGGERLRGVAPVRRRQGTYCVQRARRDLRAGTLRRCPNGARSGHPGGPGLGARPRGRRPPRPRRDGAGSGEGTRRCRGDVPGGRTAQCTGRGAGAACGRHFTCSERGGAAHPRPPTWKGHPRPQGSCLSSCALSTISAPPPGPTVPPAGAPTPPSTLPPSLLGSTTAASGCMGPRWSRLGPLHRLLPAAAMPVPCAWLRCPPPCSGLNFHGY